MRQWFRAPGARRRQRSRLQSRPLRRAIVRSFEQLEVRQVFSAAEIIAENQLPGSPQSEWDISGAGYGNIEGFATDISVNQGETVFFKINTPAKSYRLDIYRMGYYGGAGARKVDSVWVSLSSAQIQPPPIFDPNTGLIDAGLWNISASWTAPVDAVSGIYFAKLVRTDGVAGEAHIPFIVRDDDGNSDILFQTSDSTWAAYNDWGGNSLYVDNNGNLPAGRAFEVSYNRPYNNRNTQFTNWVFYTEYPAVRWMEQNGYDVSYTTNVDTARYGSELLEHKVFLSIGHDEYWSSEMRDNVEAARDAGVNLAFFSGNEVYWKVRWDNSADAAATPYRTVVCYKETIPGQKIDPLDDTWTGTWRDPRFYPQSDGNDPENALTGTMFVANGDGTGGYAILVPADDAQMRIWRNTIIASLGDDQTAALANRTLGYEWDADVDNGHRPAGLINLSSTTVDTKLMLVDYGSIYQQGDSTHQLTLYRAASGALVFGAGTVQWVWGLDGHHDWVPSIPDPVIQQATVNLFADMGVLAGSLQPGLIPAAMSSDFARPQSQVVSLAPGESIAFGAPILIMGTAFDNGGGRVGGVEISFDNGQTWRKANGRENWTYLWTPNTTGPVTIKTRAADDSGNIEIPSAGLTINVGSNGSPESIFDASDRPTVADNGDNLGVELGVKFVVDEAGYITGVRFYKSAANIGTHIGNLWTLDGTLLATATFTGESGSGWQQVTFSKPVYVQPGVTYVASYHTDVGHYAIDLDYFTDGGAGDGPVRALADGENGGQGLFKYYERSCTDGICLVGTCGAGGCTIGGVILNEMPNQSYAGANYWVDVVYAKTIAEISVGDDLKNVDPERALTVAFSQDMDESTVNGSTIFLLNGRSELVAANVSYNAATRMATISPANGLTFGAKYMIVVRGGAHGAKSENGDLLAGDTIQAFKIRSVPLGTQHSLWNGVISPANPAGGEARAAELGMEFKTTVDGFITGARFFKSASNTWMHTASLWTNDGKLLAVGTFLNETASGWQELTFSSPVEIKANTSYVITYHTDMGRYAVTTNAFGANGLANGPVIGLKGLMSFGATGFPTGARNATAYWIDPIFVESLVSSVTPAADSRGAAIDSPLTVQFSQGMEAASFNAGTVVLLNAQNQVVPTTLSYDANTRTLTITPVSVLEENAKYTLIVRGSNGGVFATSGIGMAGDVHRTFTTGVRDANVYTLFSPDDYPSVPSNGDTAAIEVGMKFRSSVDGFITGVRFYKALGNTGTHVGNLWSSDGRLLATVTFTNETASGWQEAKFSSPVFIQANTTYIVSYFAPNGNYSLDQALLRSGVANGPLQALAEGVDGSNGVFRYGSTGFPSSTYQATYYWVDVVFNKPLVGTVTPNTPAAGIPGATTINVQFLATMDPASINGTTVRLMAQGGFTVPTTLLYNPTTRVATLTTTSPLAEGASYTVVVQGGANGVKDLAGNPQPFDVETSFQIQAPLSGETVFGNTAPAAPDNGDAAAVEVGMKFRADVNGFVTGMRFYKSTANTGSHVGTLWSSSGQKLATVTFTNETASGWQEAQFSSPVAIQSGVTYIISYFAPKGHYAIEVNGFASTRGDGLVKGLGAGVNGANGVFKYGSTGFPSDSYSSSNYFVDVVFKKALVSAVSPAGGAVGVDPTTALSVTFNSPMNAATIHNSSIRLVTAAGVNVPLTVTYDAATRVATLTPTSALSERTSYTIIVQGGSSGVKDASGNDMAADYRSSFTTVGGNGQTYSVWSNSNVPSVIDNGDPAAVEVGMKFRTDVDGFITGVRFYKSAGNTGTHTGNLWSSTGKLLASVKFSNETASGWQEATFSAPVAVKANTTYVISYFAPNGHYSIDINGLAAGASNGPVRALPSGADGLNGLYRYGATSKFPNASYSASNYWVDVVFTKSLVTSFNPVDGTQSVARNVNVRVTMDASVDPNTVTAANVQLLNASGAVVPTWTTYDTTTRVVTLVPQSTLSPNTLYMVRVRGGATGVKDLLGTELLSDIFSSFKTRR